MLALYTGDVKPHGVDLNFLAIDHPREIFDRMLINLEFEACEMSSSEFIRHAVRGDCPMVAIPVFPSRVFRHGYIAIDKRQVREPKDLAGKRIGVPLYTMSAAVWIRGLLAHDYGVDLSGVRWLQGATNKPGRHGNPSPPPMLKRVSIEDNTSGKSLSDLLEEGEIDAVLGSDLPLAVHRGGNVARLFPNFPEVEADYYKRTGIYPIMHLVAMRRDVYERNPAAAKSLYQAFCRAKDIALQRMRHTGMLATMMPWMLAEIEIMDKVFGPDPWPYGVDANRKTLEALVAYLHEQSLIARPIKVDDLFVKVD